jgi:SulP family sulfate permease
MMKRYLPILDWLPRYDRTLFRGDAVAGITVGVMLIPQSMAYASLAGLPPIHGLYASLLPLVVYSFMGSSRHLAFGIMAIDCLIVAAAVSRFTPPGTPEYVGLVLALTLMVGIFQMLLGFMRFGFLVNLLSRPVISGFTGAAAIVICLSQLKSLLGIPMPQSTALPALMMALFREAADIHVLTLLIGLAGMVLLAAIKHWLPRVPGALVAVTLSTLAVWYFRLDTIGVDTVGVIPTGLPSVDVPAGGWDIVQALVPSAIMLALVQFMTVVSLGKLYAGKYGYRLDANQELVALGASNAAAGLFQGAPVSGSFSRSAVSEGTGAQTPLSNLFAAVVVAVTLLFLTPLFFYLPIPIFASIIIMAAIGLVDIRELRYLLRTKKVDGWIALVTFTITLVIGIQAGILTGIGLSVVAIMARISRPNIVRLGLIPGTQTFRDVAHHPEAIEVADLLMVRMDASFSFANAERLRDTIIEEVADTPYRAVMIDAQPINDIDTTALAVLTELHETLSARDIRLVIGGMKEPVLETVREAGVDEEMGPGHLFMTPFDAVQAVLGNWERELLPLGDGGHQPLEQ